MLIVDGQIHLWEKGTPSAHQRQEPYSAEDAIAGIDEAGVDRALIRPVMWDPDSNELAVAAVQKYPTASHPPYGRPPRQQGRGGPSPAVGIAGTGQARERRKGDWAGRLRRGRIPLPQPASSPTSLFRRLRSRADVLGHGRHPMPCSWQQCVTLFTEELPWLKGRDLELVMGEALCNWLGWPLPASPRS
jgi:hypothetical protein